MIRNISILTAVAAAAVIGTLHYLEYQTFKQAAEELPVCAKFARECAMQCGGVRQ